MRIFRQLPLSGVHGAEARPFQAAGVEDDDVASRLLPGAKAYSTASVTMIVVALTIVLALAGTGYFLFRVFSESVRKVPFVNLFGLNKATGGELTLKIVKDLFMQIMKLAKSLLLRRSF
jgi:hypothetical protein